MSDIASQLLKMQQEMDALGLASKVGSFEFKPNLMAGFERWLSWDVYTRLGKLALSYRRECYQYEEFRKTPWRLEKYGALESFQAVLAALTLYDSQLQEKSHV